MKIRFTISKILCIGYILIATGLQALGQTVYATLEDTVSSTKEQPQSSVEVEFFQLKVISDRVELTWKTAIENNQVYFTLERAGENGGFLPIADIKGAETTYSFTDKNPLHGLNFYRLKVYHADGSAEYLNSISAWIE